MATYELFQYRDEGKALTLAQLTAAGASDTIHFVGCDNVVFAYTIASINTNVVVRVDGSLDNTNWFNLDMDEDTITQIANGTYSFQYQGRVPWLRFYFVSEAGGTDVTVDVLVYSAKEGG